ncbi:Protein mlp1 [Neocucurbitaria cava]|uniref:Protein mlp1 n=1 Tax=Neocucurbitaria cava TaxID=798079 RepID=A0A9W8YBM0_9PLEO|nr:Protein mlp1 [Neocucurbitaria cava]
MAAAAVDVGYLAASYSAPEATFHSLLTAPTVELVQSLLTHVEAKARAYDDLQSEKLRSDVELETAVQSGERRARALKATAEKAQKEAEELRQRATQEESARQQAEKELHDLQATTASSTSNVQALESRIKALESQNRDALAMHDAKSAAHDRLAKELSEQHQKSVGLRKQLSTLEEKTQTLESAATNVKFRETNLQQEIEQLRKNNDWYTAELKTRSDDYSKYRKEKNAQIAQLQRENADASETIDSLRRTETLLRQHIDELKGKADEDRLRIENLEDSAAKIESEFRIQLENARRLATLHQQSAESTKRRVEELQAEIEKLHQDAAAEIGQLQADVELERSKVAETESRMAELETLVENLQSEATEFKSSARPPATPRRGMNGSLGTPVRAGSPAVFSPGGSQLKGGPSNTQLLKENIDLKAEMRRLRQKVEEQTIMVNEMLEELERRQPEFEDLRRQNDALTAQSNELSTLLDGAIEEREAALREARKAKGDMAGLRDESTLLRHQVQDMTIQLRSLLWRREAEQNGLDSLPPEQKQFILDSVDNQVPDNQLPSDSATHNTITKHLVLYKSVAELQNQNTEILRTIRDVAEQHEAQEVRNNIEQHKKDVEELGRLQSLVEEKEEQIKSLNLRSQTFKTERDMYYRIVTSRGPQKSDSQTMSPFAQSVPAAGGEHALQSRAVPEYDKLIKDLQGHINLLKEEGASNLATSKTQVESLTKDNGQLQSDKFRLESQVRREQDRYNRLEGTIKLLQSEKDTIQERYNNVQQTLAKQDGRLIKADQEAADAATRIQGLENEMVNIKAAQNMSRTIEARLNDRIKELTDERDRLNKMVSDIQGLRNEQELTNAENRRRLQESHDKLDAELQITRRKLEDEIEEHKKATMQRDYERSEAQRRIDDLIAARNNAEVKSASAESTRQHLEQRIKELQTQLQSAEERVQSLQPRPTPRTNGSTNEEEDSASREEELNEQISELQRKIERKQEDLEAVHTQIEGFQNIAQDAEDRLQSFVEAHDRLQEELNLAQQEKDATINDLRQRVEEISSELATTTTELTELRGKHEQENLQLTQQKDILESEITRLKNDVDDYKAEAEAQSEFVKTQAEIAARAQQDYEHELDKHGETMKTLRALREEYNQVKTEIAQFKAQAESARSTLEQNKEHWKLTQDQYEGQITEARSRHDDLKQYNQTLLKQFDEYKAQIDGLKNDRAAAGAGDAGATGTGSSNLQDIEVYLRREKEILEVQFNLKDQEAKRLEQQLTHSQNQLDQAREKLLAEQSKSQTSQSGSRLQNLQSQVEQLNLFRESNTTLRNDNSRLQSQLTEKAKALEDLQSELEPLQVRVSELEGEVELGAGHLKAVEEDRNRWQKRHQDVLQRYDRIDPKDLEDLKKKIEDLQVERDQALEQVKVLNEKIQAIEAAQETVIKEAREATREATVQEVTAEEREKARKGFNKVHNEKMTAKKHEIDALTAERDELQGQLTSAQQELETSGQQHAAAQTDANKAKEQLTDLQQQLQQTQSQLATVQQELEAVKSARDTTDGGTGANTTTTTDVNMSEDGQVDEGSSNATKEQLQKLQSELEESQKRATEAQARANDADAKFGNLTVQLSLMKDRATGLDNEVVSHMSKTFETLVLTRLQAEKGNRILELQKELSDAQKQPSQSASDAAAAEPSLAPVASEEVQKLKDELATALKEIEDLRTQLDMASSTAHNDKSEADAAQREEQSALLKAALDKREADLKDLEADLDRRLAHVKDREAKSEAILEKANGRVRKIRTETNQELENLKEAHLAELERLRQEKQAPTEQEFTAPDPEAFDAEGIVETEGLPRPTATEVQFNEWVKANPGAKKVVMKQITTNLSRNLKPKTEEIARLRSELEELKAKKSTEAPAEAPADTPAVATATVKEEPEQGKSQSQDEELAKAKAEFETALKEAVAKKEESMNKMFVMRGKIKDSTINNYRTKCNVVEKAAKETPTEQVAKVWAQALEQAKNAPSAQPNTPAKQQVPAPAQQAQAFSTPPTSNATVVNQGVQNTASQQPNPFLQAQAGHGNAPNPFAQAQNQMGRGLPQPGFTGQAPAPIASQQQQQQFGRGRGDGVGTGPQALRGVLQSNIPRGGASNIPLPGGRGRGQQQQQQPQQYQNQNQGPGGNNNAPGANASQIGRGGGGRGGGRGGQAHNAQGQANTPSPGRGGLNANAQQFQPGAGRGQKRGAEDDGDGGARGGKRARGGRGRGGGNASPAAGAE